MFNTRPNITSSDSSISILYNRVDYSYDITVNPNATGIGSIASVFGRTGAILAKFGDYKFADIDQKPTTILGYGITDSISTLLTYDDPIWINTLAKAKVGLGLVDNTSDLSKPVSTATTTALGLKEDLTNKSTSVTLGTSDILYPSQKAVKTYVDNNISAGSVPSSRTINTHPLTADVVVTKADIGLGNVDNLSDINKPLSTASISALALKADLSAFNAHTANVSNPHSVTKAQVGLSLVDNTSDINKPVSTAQQNALNLKANLLSPALTGTPTTPTATVGTNTTQVASTAFVIAQVAAVSSGVTTFAGRSGTVVPTTNDYTWAQINRTTSSFADITTRSATDISSGTLADARLSANIPLINAGTNSFTGNLTVAGTTTLAAALSGYAKATAGVISAVAAIPATDITQDSTHRFATDAEKTAWNAATGAADFINTTVQGLRDLASPSTTTTYHTTDLGKQGFWYYDSTDTTSVDNTGTIIVNTATSRRYKRAYDEILDIQWFGAVADYNGTTGTDCAPAANAAIAACGKGESIIFDNVGTGTYYFNGNVNFVTSDATIKFNAQVKANCVFAVGFGFIVEGAFHTFKSFGSISSKNTGGVYTGYSGIGLYLRNAYNCNVDVMVIENFNIGLKLAGDVNDGINFKGTQYCYVHYQKIRFCDACIVLTSEGLGGSNGNWCNENTIIGGQLGAGPTSAGANYGIKMFPGVGSNQRDYFNGNRFFSTGFEGVVNGLFMQYAKGNEFYGGRVENSTAVPNPWYLENTGTHATSGVSLICYDNKFIGWVLFENFFTSGKAGVGTLLSGCKILTNPGGNLIGEGTTFDTGAGTGRFLHLVGRYSPSAFSETVNDVMAFSGHATPLRSVLRAKINGTQRFLDYNRVYMAMTASGAIDQGCTYLRINTSGGAIVATMLPADLLDGTQIFLEVASITNPFSIQRSDNSAVLLATTAVTTTGRWVLTYVNTNGVFRADRIGAVVSVDATPTSGSVNPVQSGGVFTALALKAPLAAPSFTGLVSMTNTSASSNQVHLILNGVSTASAGTTVPLSITPTFNESGTAANNALFISPFYQANGSGLHYLIRTGTNTAGGGAGSHTDKFTVDSAGAATFASTITTPGFTGSPTSTTPAPADNSTKIATTAYVDAADALKANLASPALTGTPTAPTATFGDNTTTLATTAFVQANIGSGAGTNASSLTSGTLADARLSANVPLLNAANAFTNNMTITQATGSQLTLTYSGATSSTVTTNSAGDLVLTPSSGTVLTTSVIRQGGTSSNFWVSSSNNASQTAVTSQYLFAGATQVNLRVGMRGSTLTTITNGDAYGSFIIGQQAAGVGSSGTHALFAQQVIKPLSITGGAASLTNTATLYLEDAATATVTGANYTLWSVAGLNRFGGNVIADAALSVGTAAAPVASAIVDIGSTTKGVLFPRMTTTQKNAITSPAEGLVVYDTDLHKLCVRTASAWETITSA